MIPILQIVHISDLHMVDYSMDGFPPNAEWVINKLSPLPLIGAWARHGMDPHDIQAVEAFEEFISRVTTTVMGWTGPTWLVDTGDITTFGDNESLKMGTDYFAKLAAYCQESLSLYGNHDAWPGDFPAWANDAQIYHHRDDLRKKFFSAEWPEAPLVYKPRGIDIKIELYALNSVLHDPVWNTGAFGRVVHDRYWEQPPYDKIPHRSLDRLQKKAVVNTSSERTIRLLACHHPIAKVSKSPQNRVLNAQEIGEHIRSVKKVPFHIVLSGHTHALFPKHGKLRPTPQRNKHVGLSKMQVQLVVGALMQTDDSLTAGPATGPKRGEWPHQAQVLRFYLDDDDRHITVQRLLAGRYPGPGLADSRYELRPIHGTDSNTEPLRIPLP